MNNQKIKTETETEIETETNNEELVKEINNLKFQIIQDIVLSEKRHFSFNQYKSNYKHLTSKVFYFTLDRCACLFDLEHYIRSRCDIDNYEIGYKTISEKLRIERLLKPKKQLMEEVTNELTKEINELKLDNESLKLDNEQLDEQNKKYHKKIYQIRQFLNN